MIKYVKFKFNKNSTIFLVSLFFFTQLLLTSCKTPVSCRTRFGKCNAMETKVKVLLDTLGMYQMTGQRRVSGARNSYKVQHQSFLTMAQMVVSGQLHTPATLPPVKESLLEFELQVIQPIA